MRFAESNRLDPEIGSVLNLGACNEKLGHLAEAWRYFREVVERAPPGDDRIALAKARADAIEAQLGHLKISLATTAPAGAAVIKDGVDLGAGSLGIELPVDPGNHALIVRAPGHEDRTVQVTVASGERREIVLEPGAPIGTRSPEGTRETSGAPPSAVSESAPPAGHSTLSYVLIGLGGAGVVTAVIAAAEVLAKKSTVKEHCVDKVCDQEGYDAGRAGKTFSTIGTISFAVGVATLGTGIVLFTTSGHSDNAKDQAFANGFMATFGGRLLCELAVNTARCEPSSSAQPPGAHSGALKFSARISTA